MLTMKTGIFIYLEDNFDNTVKLVEQLSDFECVVANDRNDKQLNCTTFRYPDKKSFSACVNDGLRYLNQHGCDHIFIVKDTLVIPDTSIFEKYSKTYEKTGIHILFNAVKDDVMLDYKDVSISVADRFSKHFIYINRNTIKQIGYLDERYKDSFEIYDYYYRAFNKGLVPPVGYFSSADIPLLKETAEGTSTRAIVDDDTILKGLKLFKLKFGYHPIDLPVISKTEVPQFFQKIYNNYAKK